MATYKTKGTCSTQIDFEIDEATDTIKSVRFTRGCNGNTQGVAKLVEGMKVDDVISRLSGIDCAGRGTSCPDQLARALTEYREKAAG
ncbi:MAG: TIGR03905 family TSCPD domain-containing protein [Lachnospiraceae bacterium]|nr:TIGR03905 family TSCPD domain-containing protein [Lachnospiraceae bacterium]